MQVKQKAIIYMILSTFAFSTMQIIIGLTADTVPLFEQLFFRNLIATAIAYSSIRELSLPLWGGRENRKLLFLRSTTGYIGMICLFYASGHGKQGDVAIINQTSLFIVTILCVIFLKERITKYQIIGMFLAFAGSFFVLNPEFNTDVFPLLVALLAAVFSGIAYTLVGALKGREHPSVIIFFFSSLSTLFTAPLMLADFVLVSPFTFFQLFLIGVFAAMGQIFMTHSYALAKAAEMSIYKYAGILFSMAYGYFFLNQTITLPSLVGAIFVVLGGLVVYFGNKKV